MHPIFYYIIIYLLLGAIGMYLANKKAEKKVKRQRWLKYCTYVAIIGIVLAAIFLDSFEVVAVIIIVAGLYEMVKANTSKWISKTEIAILSILVYCLIAFGFWKFTDTFKQPFLLFIFFQVFVFDAFCQVTGQLIGRHALAPKISPTKTIEGLAGGWILCIISAMLASSWIKYTIVEAAFFGFITGLSSFAGDMLGSYFKRVANIKDFSNLLPGQGGFLDRFGSLMMTALLYYFLQLNGYRFQFKIFELLHPIIIEHG
jgi:phosphatidate cytidylyltransferase